jgi:tetratricopeptide (TPR) repeat protein
LPRPHPAISLVACGASAFASGGPAVAAAGAPSAVVVRLGHASGFSHIEFGGAQPRSVQREGDDIVLQFGRASPPDLTLLRVDPPPGLLKVEADDVAGGLQLRLKLAQGVDVKVGRADGATYVNLLDGSGAPAPPDQTPGQRPDPTPASGIVKLHAGLQGGVLALRFDWAAPVGAAVFRRGDAIWVVFDARARLDTSELPAGLPQARSAQPIPSADATVLRIVAPQNVQASVTAQGASWTVALGGSGPPPLPVELKAAADGVAGALAGSTGVFWLDDPAVGDRLAVVTALGPAKGVIAPRRLVDADIFVSAQGLALTPLAQDLTVSASGDVVHLGRPSGMQVSVGAGGPTLAQPRADLPAPAAMPALVDFEGWARTGSGGFLARYEALLQQAANEGASGRGGSVQARMGLARFLIGSELSFEAIGTLDLLAKSNPEVLSSPEFRGLRGAARAMAGRYKEAQADLSAAVLADDPSSAVWRGYVAERSGDHAGARQAFAAGQRAMTAFAPSWRVRFYLAGAEASLEGGDLAASRSFLHAAEALKPVGVDADRWQLDSGRLAEAGGHGPDALPFFAAAQASPYGGVATPALLYATEIQEQGSRITPNDAIGVLDSIRYRWRGDATELEAARALGRLYIAQGRYREALAVLKSTESASSGEPASAAVQGDLSDAFRSLFLNGGADGLPPVQALGLFFDFKDLTPIGADGDTIVRKLARRLVDVDLLDQAAQLLKYQADNRLDGVGRAEVDTDLALIQVMNRQPEAALDALNSSRSTLLPVELQSRRRVIEARALTALGRYDDALELLDSDVSPDARAARAEVEWRKRDWPQAGKLMEVALGDRFRSSTPLSELEETELLRAAIAYSLAGDEAGLARLRGRYGALAQGARSPNMLKVALAGAQTAYGAPPGGVASTAEADSFATWVAAMKARLLTSGLKAA